MKRFDPGIIVGQIALSSSDVVFGTTSQSGTACSTGSCVVFELTTPANGGLWNETIIHDFANDPLGRPLAGYEWAGYVEQAILSFGHDGSVYGAIAPDVNTDESNSTIYRLTPPAAGSAVWTETALYTFKTPPKPTNGTTRGFLAGSSLSGRLFYGHQRTRHEIRDCHRRFSHVRLLSSLPEHRVQDHTISKLEHHPTNGVPRRIQLLAKTKSWSVFRPAHQSNKVGKRSRSLSENLLADAR